VSLRRLFRSEIDAQAPFLVGTVLSKKIVRDFNPPNNQPVAVVRVDIGKNRVLENVIVKGSSRRDGRFYANLGQSVLLRRNGQGRFEVVAPGDRVMKDAVVNEYTFGVTTPDTTANQGFSTVREPFSFYRGDLPGTPNSGLWGAAGIGFPRVVVKDAQGNVVT